MSKDCIPRKAHLEDVKAIHALLLQAAKKGLLLPRALIYLYGHIRNFHVVESPESEVVGCCALAPVWEDMGEICSLVVREDMRGQGLGRALVRACVSGCRELRLKKIFSLTYQESFFTRLGFNVVDKDVLPQKIWADCVNCAKYPDCDEIALFLDVSELPVRKLASKNCR
ncbi:MAG: amino-acid N-acetyltransferase [Candidatus Desulfovibrio kirbyi]|jgi:amino-acid N-acetyltransferase|uniref:Amino-acid N-acetyltransferase n=1 Tax=Candidatus Desulfovibrio kirbyi TaxID=2696086 RepID=A0A6L2R4I0_9BACT|nr:N-acetyltransferase [Desulfovibrio sp.]GFH62415.1 MAG: amino-acid N-acetyltransferase [Candidatus Desulfovibrio kirbyi]